MKKKKKKELKQKSFFFEDYTESEILFHNKNSKQLKVSSSRIVFLFTIFLSLILIFSVKIIYLSLFPQKNIILNTVSPKLTSERRDIIDRNGIILARNIYVYSAGIRSKLLKNKKKFLINLKLIFPY